MLSTVGIGAVDQQLPGRPVVVKYTPLEIVRNEDANVNLAGVQQRFEFFRAGSGALDCHHLAGLGGGHQLPRQAGIGMVGHGCADTTHVQVDGVAEQQDLQQRHADDHAEGQAVTPELADFLAGNGEQVYAAWAWLAWLPFRRVGGDEHILQVGGDGLGPSPSIPACSRARRISSAGSSIVLMGKRVQAKCQAERRS